MFRQAFVLLVTTVLASLATRDWAKDRYNNYNSNANVNQFNGYKDVRDREMDNAKGVRYPSQPQYGQLVVRPQPQRQFVPGDLGRIDDGGIVYGIGGSGKVGYEIRERKPDFGEFCDDPDSNVNGKKRFVYYDDDWREEKKLASNINSNSNNNVIGMKYRRLSHWKPVYVPAPPNFGQYDNVPDANDDRGSTQSYGGFDRSPSYSGGANVQPRWRPSEITLKDYPTKPLLSSWPARPAVIDHDYNELMQPASSQNLNVNSNTNFMGGQGYDAPTGGIPQLRQRRSLESASDDPAVDKYGDQ